MNKKPLLKIVAFLVLFSVPTQFVSAASLSDLLKQRDQLNQQLENAQSAVDNKAQEAKSLSGQIKNLDSDIATTEQKINQTGNEISQTSQSIEQLNVTIQQKNEELIAMKKKLNNALVEVYRFSSRSNLQLLLGQDTLGASSNEIKYVEAVEIQVKTLYTQIESAKAQVEKQKADQENKRKELSDLRDRQESYKKGVEYQKSQKDKLLGMTIQQKQSYEAQVAKLKTEITHISNDIYVQRQKSRGREVLSGGGSGYPYTSIDEPDAWGFLTRECTSYAAWYLNVIAGKDFVNTRPGSGSAYNWPNLARDQGLSVSSTPRKGAAISWAAGSLTSAWGHVAIVEAVNGDGTIDISEYNWIRYSYSYRKNVNPGDYGSYSYIY